jgi:hypothetical protein
MAAVAVPLRRSRPRGSRVFATSLKVRESDRTAFTAGPVERAFGVGPSDIEAEFWFDGGCSGCSGVEVGT